MPKSLAEISIDEGLVTREVVVDAARRAERAKVPLVVTLVRDLDIDELGLVAAIRRHVRVPLSDPGATELDSDALREMQREVCRRLRVLPLSVSVYPASGSRMLRLAMADPTDTVAIAEVEHLTGCRVDVTLMPLSAVEEMVEKGYRAFVTEVMARRDLDRTAPASGKKARAEATGDQVASPTTIPYHRLSDEAHVTVRHQALLELLVEKQILTDDEYEERVRELMKQRDDEH